MITPATALIKPAIAVISNATSFIAATPLLAYRAPTGAGKKGCIWENHQTPDFGISFFPGLFDIK